MALKKQVKSKREVKKQTRTQFLVANNLPIDFPNLAHTIEIYPTAKQKIQLIKACGCARFAYNWGLRRVKQLLDQGVKLRDIDINEIKKEFNQVKEAQFPWIYDSPKDANQQPFANLAKAISNFIKGKAKFPKFKKKYSRIKGFYLSNDRVVFSGKHADITVIGNVKLAEELRFYGRILGSKIVLDIDRWFLVVTIETGPGHQRQFDPTKTILPENPIKEFEYIRGVDMGINDLAVTSNGEKFKNPRPLKKAQDRIRKLSKDLARKQKAQDKREKLEKEAKKSKPKKRSKSEKPSEIVIEAKSTEPSTKNPAKKKFWEDGPKKEKKNRSKNWIKTKNKLAKAHQKVRRIRLDNAHKVTKALVSRTKVLVLETLGIRGMMQNHRLAQAISDVGWSEIRRQIIYKARLYGCKVILVDRYFPSSKRCSSCGNIKKTLKLSEREYTCYSCGVIEDRDVNAAKNLRAVGYAVLGIPNCGEEYKGPYPSKEELDALFFKETGTTTVCRFILTQPGDTIHNCSPRG